MSNVLQNTGGNTLKVHGGGVFGSAAAAVVAAASYALEIIQPQPSLTTTNRFYKAYTGLEYNVRLGVIGGIFTYTHALTVKPAGMTINAATGEITWASPTETGSPHSITATVTDSEGTVETISWTLTVTTTGFKFVDASATDDTGAGTLADPWKTLPKIVDAGANDFIYFRGGNYASATHQTWDSKPSVWLAYPAETPILDLGLGTFFFTSVSNKLYIDGLTINANNNGAAINVAVQSRAITYAGSQNNITVRRNTFYGMLDSVSGQNPCYIFCTGGSYGAYAEHNVIQDNIVTNGDSEMMLAYGMKKLLIEDNNVSGMTGNGRGMNIKDGNTLVWVRGNTIKIPNEAIKIQSYQTKGATGPKIIEYNNLHNTLAGEVIPVELWTMIGEPLILTRNTVQGKFNIRTTADTNGPTTFSNNVIVNDSDTGYTDRIKFVNDAGTPTVTYDSNLVGGTADNIVDANGDLEAAYSAYLGTHGHQII